MNNLYNHGNTYREKKEENTNNNEDLRSLRSEYDYGAKKKFVDVLGNIKKHGGDGLKGLEGLKDHPGAKNMEASVRSHRSKLSTTTSARHRRFNSQINVDSTNVQPIEEKDENENGEDPPTQMMDPEGNPIELSAD